MCADILNFSSGSFLLERLQERQRTFHGLDDYLAWVLTWRIIIYYEETLTRCIARAGRDGTRAETRFCLSPKRTSPFKSVGASVQSTAGSRGVRISLSNAG